jgi:hypothetical protein
MAIAVRLLGHFVLKRTKSTSSCCAYRCAGEIYGDYMTPKGAAVHMRTPLRNPTGAPADHEGGCLCGKARFRVSLPLIDSGYCHCRMCQRNSGAPVVAWVSIHIESFSWLSRKPRTYRSSAHALREFCGRCGSYMAFRSDTCTDVMSINTSCFDEPEMFPPQKHIFVEDQISWFQTADDLPCYQDYG